MKTRLSNSGPVQTFSTMLEIAVLALLQNTMRSGAYIPLCYTPRNASGSFADPRKHGLLRGHKVTVTYTYSWIMGLDCRSPASICVYAELLLNIRQITVLASFPSQCNETTAVTVSSNRNSLSIVHEGHSVDLRLPALVRDGVFANIDSRGTKDISLRLPITEEGISSSQNDTASNFFWTASWMTSDTQVACRFCQALLVKKSVQTWKDLPSENWAEMMDFWHCHKPDTQDSPDHEHESTRKGYGAGNSIQPTAGVALVDAMYFHLLRKDCNVMFCGSSEDLKVRAIFPRSFLDKRESRNLFLAIRRRPVSIPSGFQ